MQPLSTIDDKGFRNLLATMEPKYVAPSRKAMTNTHIPILYQETRDKLKSQVTNTKSFSITTDMWTSMANQSYMSVTAHFVDDEFQLRSALLDTKEFLGAHTGVNIAAELEAVLDEWGLSASNIAAVVTDNGSNIIRAISDLEWPSITCFSHTLQLAVIEGTTSTSEICKALGRCRKLAGHFHHSPKSTDLLKQKQSDLHVPPHRLIQEVSTRWNSSFYMVERIVEQQQPLCATLFELRKGDLMPTDNEFSTMETYLSVMKPLVEITEVLGGQKYVSVSSLRPIIHKLKNTYLSPCASDNRVAKMLRSKMLNNFQRRYDEQQMKLLNKATFLDPRFKSLMFLSDSEKSTITAEIELEIINIYSNTTQDQSTSSLEPSPPKKKKEYRLLKLIDDVINPSPDIQSNISSSDKAKQEIARYSAEGKWEENPLDFWKINSTRYPALSTLAKKYLAVPATSVPSENAFSCAGHIVNKKRSCLLPENVQMLVFLAQNLQ